MKTSIIAVFFTLVAASAQAGLSTGPKQTVTVAKTSAEMMNSIARPKPAVRKMKKKPRRRQDDDDFDIDKD